MKLSVGMITFNEENKIGKTIDSIRDIADEIIVIDSGSNDRTVEIAQGKGAQVFIEEWQGYGPQKNSVLNRCKGEWILLLDADEVISENLKESIKKILEKGSKYDVFKIKLRNICFGKEIKYGGWDDYVIRLWKNGKIRISNREVHEEYIAENARIGKLNELIIHYTYDTIEQFLEKLNRYTSQSAAQYIKENRKAGFIKIYLRTLYRFLKIYILQLGFMDGYEGYLLAKYSSIYTMTKYTKLRERYLKNLGKDTSLIVTTYNWPKALKICLDSVLRQTVIPKEIIIADDGSKEETIDLIREFKRNNPNIRIVHSWQEDRGFRLSESRNKAINRAEGEYVIIVDGDLLLERHFVQDHVENREKGCFIQGSRVIISEERSGDVLKGRLPELPKILFDKGFKNKANMLRNTLFSKIFSKKDRTLSGIRGCNMSFFKDDLVEVNGFEEKITGWGREDSEIAARLFNSGKKKKRLKFKALTYHIYHKENDRNNLKENDKFLEKVIKENKKRAEKGLDSHEGS